MTGRRARMMDTERPWPQVRPAVVPGAWGRVRGSLHERSVRAFMPSVESDVRLHLLVLAVQVLSLALALHHVVVYRFLANPTPTRLLWPMAWATGLPWRPVAIALTVVAVATAVVAVLGYRCRPVRLVNALVLLVLVAALSSFGKVNHGLHHAVIAVVGAAAVPSLPRPGSGTPAPRRAYDVVLATQTLLLLTYSMSGFAKLRSGIHQWAAGQDGLFSARSLAALVADRALQTGEAPPLLPLIVDHPTLSAIAFGATVLIELLAVGAVLQARLAAGWAVALATFHLGVFWAMHINFTSSVAVLLVVFGLSPFLARPPAKPSPEGAE